MIVPFPITEEQRRVSQKNILNFNLVNGFSYMCLGETIIILLAVRIHMPDVLITFIGAMIFIGFLLLPLGVRFTARTSAAQSQATFWIYRNIAALLAAFSAFVARFSRPSAWGLLLFASFMFYGFRAAGVVLFNPLIGEVTTDRDRSRLIGRATGWFYFSGVIALLTVTTLLRLSDSIWVLCSIIVLGATTGVAASRFILGICETRVIRDSAGEPMLPQWRAISSDPAVRGLLAATFCKNLGVILLVPPSILFLKKGYGFSDMQAVLFSATQFAASFLVSRITGGIMAKKGPRFMMIEGGFGMLIISLIWIFAPSGGTFLPAAVSLFTFFFCGSAVVAVDNANTCYFLMSVPKKQQIVCSVAMNVISGAGAGLTAMLVAGGMMWLSRYLAPAVSDNLGAFLKPEREDILVYKIFFLLTVPVRFLILYSFFRLKTVISGFRETHGEEAVRETVVSADRNVH